ncbi:methylphosphate capping enzyme [Chamberlinius hualienensis]
MLSIKEMLVKKTEEFEPGAAIHGNFINYYSFNPPRERLQLIPTNLLESLFPNPTGPVLCLDVGCNSGNLTEALQDHFTQTNKTFDLKTLAFDLDPILIERAKEKSTHQSITYRCFNIMNDTSEYCIDEYLVKFNRKQFDVGFCFAVTMWIHLNEGDEGLRNFLFKITSMVQYLIIEPQPWKCYSSAARRTRRLKQEELEKFQSLKIRSNVVDYIDEVLTTELSMTRQEFPGKTHWDRLIVLYKKNI